MLGFKAMERPEHSLLLLGIKADRHLVAIAGWQLSLCALPQREKKNPPFRGLGELQGARTSNSNDWCRSVVGTRSNVGWVTEADGDG